MDRATMSISRSAVDRLLHHTWPGNVRELENTLKRGIALSSNDQLDTDDIQSVAQVLPKFTIGNHLTEITISGCHNPDIYAL